jgi:hypothetical protein
MDGPIPINAASQQHKRALMREALDALMELDEIDGFAMVAWVRDGEAVSILDTGSILPSLGPEWVKQCVTDDDEL